MDEEPVITSMPLYQNLDRVTRGLAANGVGPSDEIPPEMLFGLDQWHYHGIEAIEYAARRLGITGASRILDIGSGIGGPARYLAHRLGCQVTALELQPGLNAMAEDLTRRSGLGKLVTHVCGDAVTQAFPAGSFDAAVSWLAILHMADRPRLFRNLARQLRPGGGILIEDLCMRAPFTESDLHDLRHVVYGITVTSIDGYAADLSNGGFRDIEAEDLTADWAPFADRRLAAWRAGRTEYARVHGEDAYAGQDRFYTVIDRLYKSGSLGGVRLSAHTRSP